MRPPLSLAALALLAVAPTVSMQAQTMARRSDLQAGHTLAVHACAGCHVVEADPRFRPPVPYGPSFFDVASKPDTTEQSLQAFLGQPHPRGRMPYPDLSSSEVAEVSAYILSLRGRR